MSASFLRGGASLPTFIRTCHLSCYLLAQNYYLNREMPGIIELIVNSTETVRGVLN